MRYLVYFFCLFIACFNTFANLSQDEIKLRVQKSMSKIDSEQFSNKRLSDRDFVVSMYQQILNRNPSDDELNVSVLLLEGYELDHTVSRSHFVEQLLVLKSGNDSLSWSDLESFMPTIESLNLTKKPLIGVYSKNEDTVNKSFRRARRGNRDRRSDKKDKKKYLSEISHQDKYSVYFGYLHAHTELSDGRGDAKTAYKMARDEAGLDFFAITDHSESLHFWPWDNKYKTLISIANNHNEEGKFAALYGFEWSHPLLGHFNVINTKKYISAITSPSMSSLMRWLSKKDWAFGRFNHPGRLSKKIWPYEFRKLKVYNNALENVVGIEMWNKKKDIDSYLNSQKSFKKGMNFLDNANTNGWFVGAVGGQDNHDADWGLRNDWRVGVWAKKLSRKGIIDGYFGRRIFATEDKNASISMKFNGSEMGSRLKKGSYNVVVRFNDKDLEKVVRVKFVKKGELIDEFNVSNNQVVEFQATGKVGDYFYVIAKQKDGDTLLSSPIWIVP